MKFKLMVMGLVVVAAFSGCAKKGALEVKTEEVKPKIEVESPQELSEKSIYEDKDFAFKFVFSESMWWQETKDEDELDLSLCFELEECMGMSRDISFTAKRFAGLEEKVKVDDAAKIYPEINDKYLLQAPLHYGWDFEKYAKSSKELVGDNEFLVFSTMNIDLSGRTVPKMAVYHLLKGDFLYTFVFRENLSEARLNKVLDAFELTLEPSLEAQANPVASE